MNDHISIMQYHNYYLYIILILISKQLTNPYISLIRFTIIQSVSDNDNFVYIILIQCHLNLII